MTALLKAIVLVTAAFAGAWVAVRAFAGRDAGPHRHEIDTWEAEGGNVAPEHTVDTSTA